MQAHKTITQYRLLYMDIITTPQTQTVALNLYN